MGKFIGDNKTPALPSGQTAIFIVLFFVFCIGMGGFKLALAILLLAAGVSAVLSPDHLSSNQGNSVLSFSVAGNASSVFLYYPKELALSNENLICPVGWFKDAEFREYLHCACASPCNSVEKPVVNVSLAVPAPGNYPWRVVHYGSVEGSDSEVLTVETPAQLLVSFIFPSVVVSGQSVSVPFVLRNDGEAVAKNVSVSLKGLAIDSNPVVFDRVSGIVQGNLTASVLGVQPGSYPVVLEARGSDEFSGNSLLVNSTDDFELKRKAQLEISLDEPVIRVVKGRSFDVTGLVRNAGASKALGITVSTDLTERGFALLDFKSPTSLEGAVGNDVSLSLSMQETGVFEGSVFVSGVDGVSGEHLLASAPVSVIVQKPSDLIVVGQLSSSQVVSAGGQVFSYSAVVKNQGESAARDVTALLSTAGACSVDAPVKQAGLLASGEEKTLSWLVKSRDFGGDCVLTVVPGSNDAVTSSSAKLKASSSSIAVQSFASMSLAGLKTDLAGNSVLLDGERVVTDSSDEKLIVPLSDSTGKRVGIVELFRKGDVLVSARFAADSPSFDLLEKGKASASLSVGLNSVPGNSSVSLNLTGSLPEGLSFAGVASEKGLSLESKPVVLVVGKNELEANSVTGAQVNFALDPIWVGQGKDVRVFRESEGKLELLPTALSGTDSSGRLLYSANSSGLSVFAVYVVSELDGADRNSPATGLVSASGIEGFGSLIFVALLLVFAYVFYRKKQKKAY